MRQRHFKLLKLKDSILVFIFDYAILVKNMNKKSKIKASFVGFIFNSDNEIRIANNIGSVHHQKRFWDQVKNRLYIVKKKVLKSTNHKNCIFDTIKLARDHIFQFLKDLCWVREQNTYVSVFCGFN